MLLYPAGHVRHADRHGYSFFFDSFSDLGQTRTLDGKSNLPSLVLFCAALGLTGIALPAFFAAYAALFAPKTPGRRIAVAGACAAAIAGLAFAGIAATPANLFQLAHNVFVYVGFRALLLAMLCAFAATLSSHVLPRSVAAVFGSFALLLAAYIVVTAVWHIPGNPSGLHLGVTAQKIVVYAAIGTVLIQAATLSGFPKCAPQLGAR